MKSEVPWKFTSTGGIEELVDLSMMSGYQALLWVCIWMIGLRMDQTVRKIRQDLDGITAKWMSNEFHL